MLSDRSVDAPEDAVRYAKNLYRTRAVEPAKSVIQRVLAVLQMDLAPNKAAFGERSAAGSQARQMLFESGDNAVDIRISFEEGEFDIYGQILGEGFANAQIELGNENISIKETTDEMSEFKIVGLTAGTYELTIKGSETEIVIEHLILK